MFDVSIIIINYNTLKMTNECICSVIEQTSGISYEIILVDNASTDGSKEFFSNDSRVKYIYSQENLGFGQGNNLGIAQAKGQYIFLLNSDTLLTNNAVGMFMDYEKSHNGNLILGCMMRDREGRFTSSFGDFPRTARILSSVIKSYFKPGFEFPVSEGQELDVEMIVGADMFIPREAFETTGCFDNAFFMYYEETDLQKRMADRGFIRRIIPGPGIIHFGGCSDTTPQKASRQRYNLTKSLFIYQKKHLSKVKYILFRIAYSAIRTLPSAIKKEDKKIKTEYLRLLYSKI